MSFDGSLELNSERTCGFTTARSRLTHMKYARFFVSRTLRIESELTRFVSYVLERNLKRSYCYKILETLALAFMESREHEKQAKRRVRVAQETRARLNRAMLDNRNGGNGSQASAKVYTVCGTPVRQRVLTDCGVEGEDRDLARFANEGNNAPAAVCFDPSLILKVYQFCSERMLSLTDAMVYGCRHTGCRPIELLKLTVSDWHLLCTEGACYIHSKTGRVVFVMAQKVAQLIHPIILAHSQHCNDEERARLYCRALREFNQIWKKVHGTNKPKGDGFKLFRCLVAYEGLTTGRDVYGLKQLLRHSTVNMTEHYAKKFGPIAAKRFVAKHYPGV